MSAVLAVRSRVVRGRRAVVSESGRIFPPFPLFSLLAAAPHHGGVASGERGPQAGEREPQAGERAVSSRRGPQAGLRSPTTRCARERGRGRGSLDAADWVPHPHRLRPNMRPRSWSSTRTATGWPRVLHVRSSRACRCSRRPCSSRSTASAQLVGPPPRRVRRPVDAHGRRGGDRAPPLVETLVLEDGLSSSTFARSAPTARRFRACAARPRAA